MISVCMATYNGANYIQQQLQTILDQLSVDDEIIISDDHSTDSTLEVIESFHDSRLKVYEHDTYEPRSSSFKGFRKATNNFENALRHAKGDYIFFSDQDDMWLPGKAEKMVQALQTADFVQCNCTVVDGQGKTIQDSYRTHNPVSTSLLKNLVAMPFLGCCCAFRKEVLKYALPFPNDLLAHDFWVGALACAKGKCAYLSEPLHAYRNHGHNVSPAGQASQNSLWLKLTYRMTFLAQLLNRLYL